MSDYSLKVKLVKLSVCTCGYNLLNDDIVLGTEFTVYPNMRGTVTLMKCGGCGGKSLPMQAIGADSIIDPVSAPRLLPIEIFETIPGARYV